MHIDKLLAHGADSVAGDILFQGKSLGRMIAGEFHPSAHGLKVIEELEGEPVKAVAPVKPRKKHAVETPPPAETPAADADLSDLSTILG